MITALALSAVLVLNPQITQGNIHTTICVAGWSAKVRPPASVTDRIKRQRLPLGGRMAAYELDHIVPLSLAGAPRDPRNLQLQPWPEARRKDALERALHRAVCAGTVSLVDAETRIAAWKP